MDNLARRNALVDVVDKYSHWLQEYRVLIGDALVDVVVNYLNLCVLFVDDNKDKSYDIHISYKNILDLRVLIVGAS